MAGTRSPWVVEAGEHVCWQVRSAREYADGENGLLAHARRWGGGVLIVGGSDGRAEPGGGGLVVGGADGRVEPAGGFEAGVPGPAALEDVRRQAYAARRDGRLLWVLAAMEWLARPDAGLHDVVACELELAELAAETETGIVCAYQVDKWHSGTVGDIAPVHSRVVGVDGEIAGFRLRYAGANGYCLDGSVGFECLRAFSAALRGALARSPRITLRCEHLELIDAAGWRAVVEAAAEVPGAQIVMENANETVLGTWRLSGYRTAGVTVRGGS